MSTDKDTLATDNRQEAAHDGDMPLYLREWREHRNLTGPELADRIGCHRSYISKWETRERPLTNINWIKKICDVLETTPEDLHRLPPKVGTRLTVSQREGSDTVQTADVAVPSEGIEMLEKRIKLHESLEELPDELLETATSLINRLKTLGGGNQPSRPTTRASTKT